MTQLSRPLSQELSFRAIFLGIILAVVMGAANVYLGLRVGMTVSASIPSAVLAMLILRGVFRTGTIWEANQVQNAASAGEALAAGIIFTMPAMIIIGAWKEFDMWMTTLVAFAGGILGVLFMIPMRKVFISTDHKNSLPYPEAVACAAVLKTGSKETGKSADAMGVVYGALFGASIKVLTSFAGVMKGSLEGAASLSNRIFYVGGDIAAALLAIGYIVGLNVSILVFLGAFISWGIALPFLGIPDSMSAESLIDTAWYLYKTELRFLGVGAMAVGGIVSIYNVRHGLVQAIRELSKAFNKNHRAKESEAERDIPTGWLIGLMVVCTIMIAGIYYNFTNSTSIAGLTTIIMIVMGFFFTAVASYIVGLVGNSNSPVSGMTITAVLGTAALLFVFGFTGTDGMVATLGVAAIVCCVASTAGDMCNELKIGYLVGSSPGRQQFMQILGVAVASLVLGPVMQLLHDNTPGGLGGRELPAPQAGLFASLAQGFFGEGHIPWSMVYAGAGIAIMLLVLDGILRLKGSNFRLHVMPIAVGLYLGFGVAIPMLIGGLLAAYIARGSRSPEETERRLNRGVLFSSGAIAGESLLGVGLAALAGMGITAMNWNWSDATLNAITYGGVVLILAIFYRAVRVKKA